MPDINDYKKAYRELYSPKQIPAFINVPNMKFIVIDGKGDPNSEEFALAASALYSFSYAVKMSYKSSNIPEGYYNFVVFPLEGEWDLDDKSKAVTDKSNYIYRIMIRQPEFLTKELYERFLSETKKKKPNEYLNLAKFEEFEEGLCCQMLHIGGYDEEPASFNLMNKFCSENGYARTFKAHREIYLSDPRKTDTAKLKTILRFKVEVL